MSYFSLDRTFCSKLDCPMVKCDLHPKQVSPLDKPYFSVSDFEGSAGCIRHTKPKKGINKK